MHNPWQRLLVLMMLAAALLPAACSQPYQFKGTPFPEGKVAPDFELIDEQGQPFRVSDLEDEVVMIFFGYTSCPDVCPTTLAEARQVLEGLGDRADRATFLFVTVDPERDTVQRLAEYTGAFHSDIVGLTGDPETLAAMREAYGVIAEREDAPDSALGYIMNHTARVFLVDPQGYLRLSYRFGTPPQDILADVQHLLQS